MHMHFSLIIHLNSICDHLSKINTQKKTKLGINWALNRIVVGFLVQFFQKGKVPLVSSEVCS